MAQSRHAHFQNEEDSGDDSSPGLQFESRRLRSNTVRHSAVTSDVDNTMNPHDSGDDIQLTPSEPVPIAGTTRNVLHLHQVTRPSELERSAERNDLDSVPKDGDNVPPPSIGNSPESSKRPKVRMNSTPVSVSMPLTFQEPNIKNTDGLTGGLARAKSQRSLNSPRASWSSDQQRILSEKLLQGRASSRAASVRYSVEAATEKPVSANDRSDPLPGPKTSRISKWLSEMYAKVKASRRVSWIIPTVTDYNLMKPVIRCSVSAWLGLVFLLINPILRVEGQSAFFSVVVAFIAPPNLPFIQAMEQIIYLWVFVGLAWVWVIICAACISAVRTNDVNPAFLAQVENKYSGLKATNPEQYQRRIIFEGTYIQAKPAVLCAVFLAVGTAVLTLIKIKTAPSPYTFALVLSCVLMAVCFTLLHYFPYNYYDIGSLFMLPMTFQLAIAIFCSIFVFPTSVSSSFTLGLNKILKPVLHSAEDMLGLFDDMVSVKEQCLSKDRSSTDEELLAKERERKQETLKEWAKIGMDIRNTVASAASALGPLKAQESYLTREASFSRFAGKDIQELFVPAQGVQLRFGGIGIFFEIIATAIEHTHLDSAVFTASASRPPSPSLSRATSLRPGEPRGSPRRSESHTHLAEQHSHIGSPLASQYTMTSDTAVSEASSRRDSHLPHSIGHVLHKRLHLPHLPISWRPDREDHGFTHDDRNSSHTSVMDHLRKDPPAVGVYESMKYMALEQKEEIDPDYFIRQFGLLAKCSTPLVKATIAGLKESVSWHLLVDKDRSIYRGMLGLRRTVLQTEEGIRKHRTVTQELEETLQRYRQHDRLQILEPFRTLFDEKYPDEAETDKSKLQQRKGVEEDSDDIHDEVDPDDDLLRESLDLGHAKRRDPDNKAFSTPALNALRYVGKASDFLTSKEAFFSLKAGILVVCLALPAYIQSSAGWYYYEKGFWALIMGQLTISLNSAETAAAWLQRIQATFWGCLVGLLMWYISTGDGHGNRYGLAVVTAICFPLLMTVRIYWPGPPLAGIIFGVSAALVVSYSWINTHLLQTTNLTYGWNVAYTRFIAVTIGITAAWIISALPPTRSARKGIRRSYAGTVKEMGAMFCDIISEMLDPYYVELPDSDCTTRKKVLAMKRRLVKLKARHANIGFELSFKGVWPADRYSLSKGYGFTIAKEQYHGIPTEVTVSVLESQEYQQYALATSTIFFV
ncbi:hypothetical protein QFC22_001909 [Naganishia vaughanmartiniae]|uniref:Uncharacterized protein n=1 Tax=Naganishia vaughanmartiniae TaxID=1424756 RepID=A0ACC2XFR7_9TREE|nr:hypothetical protein QFC22_001909 [Naganishia vaughanmartiniae]